MSVSIAARTNAGRGQRSHRQSANDALNVTAATACVLGSPMSHRPNVHRANAVAQQQSFPVARRGLGRRRGPAPNAARANDRAKDKAVPEMPIGRSYVRL